MITFLAMAREAQWDEVPGQNCAKLYKRYEWPVLPSMGDWFDVGAETYLVENRIHTLIDGKPMVIVSLRVPTDRFRRVLCKDKDWYDAKPVALQAA